MSLFDSIADIAGGIIEAGEVIVETDMFKGQLLTSDQWLPYMNSINKYHAIIIEHAGGWNAHNLHYEWYKEKITQEEFERRLQGSVRRVESKKELKKKGITNYEFHP